ncbi:resistance to Congo red protein [Agromyces seonyuensis]|uniref:SHOCT domain-containing protein n=1 Tax=Agromyces seonyuensis TaxID=2662446 RepID=A0A6I4NZI0_9MICO|nr:resistance to Congo red protein [Agromyces seonyuensis]MWB98642.1 SHOCT domain-containing protein [Agromyces seonyuensis]
MPDDFTNPAFSNPPGGFGAFGVVFGVVFVLVSLVIAAGFVFVVVAIVRNARRARAHGLDPMTMETDLAARVFTSDLLAPAESIESRLARVDALRQSGAISADEHAQARAAIVASA